jgi:hypothetical protein
MNNSHKNAQMTPLGRAEMVRWWITFWALFMTMRWAKAEAFSNWPTQLPPRLKVVSENTVCQIQLKLIHLIQR